MIKIPSLTLLYVVILYLTWNTLEQELTVELHSTINWIQRSNKWQCFALKVSVCSSSTVQCDSPSSLSQSWGWRAAFHLHLRDSAVFQSCCFTAVGWLTSGFNRRPTPPWKKTLVPQIQMRSGSERSVITCKWNDYRVERAERLQWLFTSMSEFPLQWNRVVDSLQYQPHLPQDFTCN